MLFGVWLSDAVTYADLLVNMGLATAGKVEPELQERPAGAGRCLGEGDRDSHVAGRRRVGL